MICKTAVFEVGKEGLDESLNVIREFVAKVKKNEPGTRIYMSWQDPLAPTKFLHFMMFDDTEAERIHRKSDWVKEFVEVLYQHTTEPTVFTDYTLIATT